MTTKAIYYYSLTGKTEAILESINSVKIVKLNNIRPDEFRFGDEDTIIIGSPTYGRGVPPIYFKEILSELNRLRGRNIGLFGSGNTVYGDDYCGALDVLQELLNRKNNIIFKFKFEGYPRPIDQEILKKYIEGGEY